MNNSRYSIFIEKVNSFPSIFKKPINWLIWLSPFFTLFQTIVLPVRYIDTVEKYRNFIKLLNTELFSQLEDKDIFINALSKRADELETIGVSVVCILGYITSISVLRWHFKGPPTSKSFIVRILQNPLLTFIPFLIYSFIHFFGSDSLRQLIIYFDTNMDFKILIQNILYWPDGYNPYGSMVLWYLKLIIFYSLAVFGNKKARNLI
tara:strand:- start:11 stop:628 length:618 start_codon:yes stop_codon:yes gene_type:complete